MYLCLNCKHINSDDSVLTGQVLFRVDRNNSLGFSPILRCSRCFQSNLYRINLIQVLLYFLFKIEP